MQNYTGLEVAIIGMSGRFPGAKDIAAFWANLKNGVESVDFFSDEVLLANGEKQENINHPNYVKANAYLKDKEYFDAGFFNYRPDEAKLMDPQMRIFHECVWEALEDAGCDPTDGAHKIGLYAGSSTNSNWVVYSELMNRSGQVDDFTLSQLNNARYIASRVSYSIDLKGPAIMMDTACSSSLVAIQQACKGLLLGDFNIAIAGGVSVNNKSEKGYWYAEGMIHSRDGHCRTFDDEASGTVGGEGAAVVVLKSLKHALKDGDHIWAIIKGGSINNDGSHKVSFTAPSIDGQVENIMKAQKWAKVEPQSISYIEAHGTGTILGDPIEVEALKRVFGESKEKYCALGAVKSNVGHLDSAAGAAGFIKTALAINNKQIPPTLNFNKLNSKIDIEHTPFYINTTLKEWTNNGHPIRAGVSSFGVGGTNAHIILEEAPEPEPSSIGKSYQILLFSGKTAEALQKNIHKFTSWIQDNRNKNLADIAYTLQTGRTPFAYRAALGCKDLNEAITALTNETWKTNELPIDEKNVRSVIFMFQGQGTQYVNMYLDLYQTEPFFKTELDKCFEIIQQKTGKNLKAILFPSDEITTIDRINQTEFTQPALFAVQYAVAQLLIKWGVKPDIMTGHSIGEYVAACISGVFTLEEALLLVCKRGELMQQMQPGAMLSVSITPDALYGLLNSYKGLSVAALNSSELCVVAGEQSLINDFKASIVAQGYNSRIIHTSHAFHSHMMDEMLDKFYHTVNSIKLQKPEIPFLSNLSGLEATAAEVTTARYWVNHLRHTVKFSQGLETLMLKDNVLFIEMGPGTTLGTFAKSHVSRKKGHRIVQLVKAAKENGSAIQYLQAGLAEIWLNGIKPNWNVVYESEKRNKISLPTYAFEKVKYPVNIDVREMLLGMLDGQGSAVLDQELNKWQDNGLLSNASTLEIKGDEQVGVKDLSETEIVLLKLWQQFFGKNDIAIDDNFFEIGGDSLKAVTIIARINREVGIQFSITEFFKMPTVKQLSDYINTVNKGKNIGFSAQIMPAENKTYYQLSVAQKRLYFLYELDKSSLAYNMPHTFKLEGKLDKEKLTKALNNLVNTYEVFRTIFKVVDSEIVQEIIPDGMADLVEYKLGNESEATLINAFVRSFDLQQGPLIRFALIQLAEEEHLFTIDSHHIISDGISQGIIIKKLIDLYSGAIELAPVFQYKDYAEWQQGTGENTLANAKEFWLLEFSTHAPQLHLPMDFSRPPIKSYEGRAIDFTIDASATAKLKKIAAEEGVTMFMVILTLYNVLLAKLTDETDIVIGTPVSGRQNAVLEDMLGMFVNTLALRNQLTDEETFKELLRKVKSKTLACFDHQGFQYGDLIEELNVERNTSHNPLFDVLFSYQRVEEKQLEKAGILFKPYAGKHNVAQFDLTLWAMEREEHFDFRLEYCTALFSEQTIEKFISYFKNIVTAVCAHSETLIGDIDILFGADRKELLEDFNASSYSYPSTQTFHSLFENSVRQYGDRTALVFEEESMSYATLNAHADEIAARLKSSGVKSGDIVGIMLHRSQELLFAILGVLKSGCTYLPIDPEYPIDRIKYVEAHSKLQYIITQSELKPISDQLNAEISVIDVKAASSTPIINPHIEIITSESPAYVIYTSGSTGMPKGVVINHKNLVNFIYGVRERIAFNSNDTILCLTTVSFDIFILEALLPLTLGMKIVIASNLQQRDGVAIENLIAKFNINMLQMTPSHLKLLLSGDQSTSLLKGVKSMMIGGEAFPIELLKELQEVYKGQIYNMYGPTETTVWSSIQDLTKMDQVNIGKPIANTVIRILNKNKKLQPIGLTGEIYIGGEGVSKGYLNNEVLTAERFLQDPFDPKIQLYRTGDIGRWQTDGNIVCLGRVDNQVKIRGFRIELGEIEYHISEFDGITDEVVQVKERNGEKYLIGYFTAAHTIDAIALNAHLSRKLPHYMLPWAYMQLESFPLTPNGKLDRKALPDPESSIPLIYTPPSNETERKLVKIWAEVLKIDAQKISVTADFFELGGHSLRAAVAINKINQLFNSEIPLKEIFNKQTIENLANYIITIGFSKAEQENDDRIIEITL